MTILLHTCPTGVDKPMGTRSPRQTKNPVYHQMTSQTFFKADGSALKNLLARHSGRSNVKPYLETGQDLWTSTSISVSFESVFCSC